MAEKRINSYLNAPAYLGSQKNGLVVLKKEILRRD